MRYNFKYIDWLRPLAYVLLRILAWAALLFVMGGIFAYAIAFYFTIKGF